MCHHNQIVVVDYALAKPMGIKHPGLFSGYIGWYCPDCDGKGVMRVEDYKDKYLSEEESDSAE